MRQVYIFARIIVIRAKAFNFYVSYCTAVTCSLLSDESVVED